MSHHRIRRVYPAVIAFVLAALLAGVALAAGVILLGYQITFVSATQSGNLSTWTYKVEYVGPDKYELSHWTLEVCPDYSYVSQTNELNCQDTFGKDPTTGLYGIKWEDCTPQIGPDHPGPYLFSVTLSRMAPPLKEDVPVSVKAGQNEATGLITGPSCSPNAIGLRNFQANTVLPSLAAFILAAIVLGAGIVLWRRRASVA